MSYSRWANIWPGGAPSWYIYDDISGKLAIWPSEDYPMLSKKDTIHLRDILNAVLEDWDEEEVEE